MNYLKEFSLSNNDLDEIYESLSNEDWQFVTATKTQIKQLLRYLVSIGITNIKDIFLYRPNVLYEYADDVKKYIEESNVSDIVEKINEDIENFDLLGL